MFDKHGSNKVRIVVLGAGAGGVATALELAKRGYHVTLVEANADILLGSSNATPGRAGHGYHYIDPKTGILYLDATTEVLREFPGCTLGAKEQDNHPMRHGLYMVMKEKKDLEEEEKQFASLFPVDKILKTYEELRAHYKQKVAEDPRNKLFGEPEDFFRVVQDKDEFKDVIDVSKIAAIVDTREELLNWPMVRAKLRERIMINPKINLKLGTRVQKASYVCRVGADERAGSFNIETDKGSIQADYVVNATWQNMRRINQTLGLENKPALRTLRLKGIVKVILPESLRDKPSMFFCMGPHCMFSNMGDGSGMMTYAPVTNITSSTGLKLSKQYERFLNGEASREEKDKFARKIIEGVCLYIPAMKDAIVTDVNFGVIKTAGTVDVFDPSSAVHKRNYLGVVSQKLGWVDNSCMKLLYFLKNAAATVDMVEAHMAEKEPLIQAHENHLLEKKCLSNKGFLVFIGSIVLALIVYVLRASTQTSSNAFMGSGNCLFPPVENNNQTEEGGPFPGMT